jgi:glycosyltransferase involved in cell wall biosynthesis
VNEAPEQGTGFGQLPARLVVSAYACDPNEGSEPGAGWAWAMAAASVVENVTIVTRENNVAAVREGLAASSTTNVEVIGHDCGDLLMRLKKCLPFGTQLYYLAWQHSLSRRAAAQWDGRFDLAHHLTFAVDWMPAGISRLAVPFAWGPVGGASRTPLHLFCLLPASDWAGELLRGVIAALGRRIWGRRVARQSAFALFQNEDELRHFPTVNSAVHPNVVTKLAPPTGQPALNTPAKRQAIVVGRLVGLKGVHLVLKAMARREAHEWDLAIIGDGPRRNSLERLARQLGIAERVSFVGKVPHAHVHHWMETADALVSASLHEAAGFAVAEAVASGCPVVYVDAGGPRVLVPPGSGVAVPMNLRTSRGLALALQNVGGRLPRDARWSSQRLPSLLHATYGRVLRDQ